MNEPLTTAQTTRLAVRTVSFEFPIVDDELSMTCGSLADCRGKIRSPTQRLLRGDLGQSAKFFRKHR